MEIKDIDVNKIKVKENSRLENSNITGLAKSIKENGLLQPIVVKEIKQPSNGFEYELIIGHRRYAAVTKKLKWNKISSIIWQNMNEKGAIVRNLVENLQREDVSAAEVGRYYHRLMKEFNMSIDEISKELGIPECRVKTAIDVYSYVPIEYRERVRFVPNSSIKQDNIIPANTAKEILDIEREQRLTVDDKSKLFEASLDGTLSGDKLKLAGIFLKYGMAIDDAIKLSDEYDIVRVYVPIKKKEIEAAMEKHNVTSKRKLFRDILAGDLKVTFNIPKWEEERVKG